jgi:predicted unusual protein kinase regulating ubiquinone biosynthesis (AarF/ABC1/UbiB family)
MKNYDRHDSNYGFRPDGRIVMIDHGLAFDRMNFSNKMLAPDYIKPYAHEAIHPEAVQWLNGVDENEAAELLDKVGVFYNDLSKESFKQNIRNLKANVKKPKATIKDLFNF